MILAKTSDKAKNAWNSRNYDTVLLTVRKGEKDKLKAAALAEGQSLNRFLLESVNAAHPDLLTILDNESKRKKPTEDPDTSLY